MPLIPKLILFSVLILPLTGSVYLLFIMLRQCGIEKNRLGAGIIALMTSIGGGLWIFLVVLFWIPNLNIPSTVKFVACILLVPYLAGLFALQGLGPALGISGFNTRRMFRDLFQTKRPGQNKDN